MEILGPQSDNAGSQLKISEIAVNGTHVSVNFPSAEFTVGSSVPEKYSLLQNDPNLFNAHTVIKYQLPKASRVVLKIYNTLGQEVRTLADEEKKAGYHSIIWDGKNNEGSGVSSGIYIYRIQAGDFVRVKKMLFVR